MRTYDDVEYDPGQDALLVATSPDHNPMRKEVGPARLQPLWHYRLETREWSIVRPGDAAPPSLFGSATAHDPFSNSAFICKHGLWKMDLLTDTLTRMAPAPNCLHRTMAFDSWRRQLYLFGAYRRATHLARFPVDGRTDDVDRWEQVNPSGDSMPAYTKTPVAFDEGAGVFLLVVDDGRTASGREQRTARTFVYAPVTDAYIELKEAEVESVGMSFMLAWEHVYKAFFLVTGSWRDGATVWALRLEPEALPRSH